MVNKNPIIDMAKGIAIILVVYGHVIEHTMVPWGQDFFQNPAFKVIYTFHMPLFFFISGYLIFNSLNKHKPADVFRIRCQSLLVPFLTTALLGTGVILILNHLLDNKQNVDIIRILADQLILKPQVWFLFVLFILSSVLIYSFLLGQRFGFWVIGLIYLMLLAIPFNNYCDLYLIKWFYLFYLSGFLFNKYQIMISNLITKQILLAFFLMVFAGLCFFWTGNDYIYNNQMNVDPHHWGVTILRYGYRYLMGFLGIGITFIVGESLLNTKLANILGKIGQYSLDIFIIQMFLLEGIYPRFIYQEQIHLDFNTPVVLYILGPVLTMCFVVVCILFSKCFIRSCPILNRCVLGSRV